MSALTLCARMGENERGPQMDEARSQAPQYRTIEGPVTATLVEKKSRFLCLLAPVQDEDEVQAQLFAIKKEHWSANHHCYAYRLQDGSERASDDGEPSGTAGRPMLHVLSGQGLTGVLAVVTRYFGGTLLGAGGLVRAYSGAVAAAVQAAQIVTFAVHERYLLPLDYAEYERVRSLLASEPGWRVEEAFTDVVTLTLTVPEEDAARAHKRITALTRGTGHARPVERLWLPRKT